MASDSDSDSSASSPSSSESQPSPSPPPPPPPSDDQKSPPPSSPPPPSEQNSGSSPSPPPPSSNGWDHKNSKNPPPPPPPPPPVPSSQTSNQRFSPPSPPYHRLSPPVHNSTSGSSNSNSGPPSSGGNGAQFNIALIGLAAVTGGFLLILVILLIIEHSKNRKKRSDGPIYYYSNQASHGDDYYKRATTQNHQQWNNSYKYNNGEQIHIIPETLGGNAKGWVISPSPPPHLLSSDMSNSSYSGSQGPAFPPPHPSVALGFHKSNYTFDELSAATGEFAQVNLLGQGGFGYVHKGVLPNGKEIAVKSLKSTGGQGDREFQAEVEVINRVHHRHLVSLVGYCISEGKNLLVYEFVPNKTLEFHLHGKGRPVMEWSTRLKIAIGSAKGLAYLHEDCHPRIIHRDIKAANILIEDNFEAKVADFGLAKFNQDNHTHVSTRVMGTFGYMAPEYASSGKLTEKSDVFSYGVMLLELITGWPPIDTTGDHEEDCLVEWARPLCEKAMETGDYEGLVDPRLENNYEKQELARMVACAAASVRHSARRRPRMSQIVRALDGDASLDVLSEGVRAGQSSIFSNATAEYDASTSDADMSKFRKPALESGCASSSDFSRTTNSTPSNHSPPTRTPTPLDRPSN